MKINPLFKAFLETTEEQKRGLEQQILKDEKIIYPLVIGKYTDENGEIQEYLIDGHSRYDIAIRHNLPYTIAEPIEFKCISDVYDWMFNQQKNRRNWNEWQEFEAVKKLKEVLAEIGKKKYQETVGRPNKSLSIVDNDSQKHDTRQAVADKIGWSTGKVAMAEVVAKNAPTETIKQLQKQEISINQAYKEVKREQKREEVAKIANAEPKEFVGLYDVVVIDPPWPMEKIERECSPNQVRSLDYPVMTEDELKNFKLPLANDCHVWLWTTHKFMPMAFRLLDYWQLKYVCCFTWHKNGAFQPFGLPQYNCEFALYARNGTPKFIDTKDFKVCFNAERGRHSEKPEEFYEVVNRVTSGRRVDIFNRREIKGFDRYGNEVQN